jgi:anthranilate 1,2-dioxygenase (deaminating, decarboxylating) large subunit
LHYKKEGFSIKKTKSFFFCFHGEKISMKIVKYFLIAGFAVAYYNPLLSYDLPLFIDLGTTNILSGGPKIESPGLYWFQYQLNYYSNKFLDGCGNLLGGIKSPSFDIAFIFTEFLYQSKFKIFGGAPGASVILPPLVFSTISHNSLDLTTVKAGLSNPVINLFFQWDMIHYNDRPFFIHRIGSFIFLPCGTNKYPKKTINPAYTGTYIDTYWTATLFATEKLAASWRMFYLWCGKNKKTGITPGNTFHIDYDLEYEVHKNCWIAINGYYLQQLQNSKQCGVDIPNSKERVVGVGPGFLLFLPRGYQLLGHLYFETAVRNRSQGISAYLNFIKYF